VNLFVLLAYGGSLFIRGEIPLGGGLMVFAGLLQQFSGQVNNLANITDSVQRSLIGARRVFEVLDTPIEIQSPPNAIRLKSVQGKIEFENVCFEYAMRERVLHQLNFTVQPGQMVAILGATGSGKSALMSLIPRFYDPTSGRIRIDGYDLKDVQLEDLRRKIGLVFQESFLFNASVAANIAFGHPEATRTQIEKAACIAAAHDFISSLPRGYDTLIQEAGSNLSGGQRQRLAIARAVLLEPAILLLDDPTAAIDSETEHEILEAIDQAVVGRTTFIVAHRLSTLRRADLILVLEDGHIVQQGSHEELMKLKGPYHRVAVLQLNQDDSREILETDLAASRRLKGETGS
jgi:ABC-type multidrug transport system fused ATPase/permease subunit